MDTAVLEFYLRSLVTIIAFMVPLFFSLNSSLLKALDDALAGTDAPASAEVKDGQHAVEGFFWATDALTYTLLSSAVAALWAGLVIWYDRGQSASVLIVLVAIPVALWAGSVILLLRKVRELREQWTAFHERLRALVGLVVAIAIVCLALVLWQLWNPLMTTMFCLVILQIIVWLLCGWVYCPLTKLHELRCALRARSNARSCRE